jgi:hypothetical protein
VRPDSLLFPYSQLVLQALAVLFAGVVLARFAGRTPAQSVGLAGGLFVAVVAASSLWLLASGSGASQRNALAVPAGMGLEEKCLGDQSTQQLIPLGRLINQVVPPDAVYSGVRDPCLAFQVLPRLPARPGQRADWKVYPDGLPPALRRQARRQSSLPDAERTVFATPEGLGIRRLPGPEG